MLNIMGQLLLALCTICALLSAGSALRCNSCTPVDDSGACTDTVMTCPASQTQCAVAAVTVSGGISTKTLNEKSCTEPELCTGPISINFGIVRTTVNAKCCKTDLCNTGTTTAYTDTTPSGLECYSCAGEVCKETILKCLGVEDRCVKVVIEAGGQKLVTKGCGSKNACSSQSIPGVETGGASAATYCCEGKLCNGARQVGQNILLLLLPLSVKLLF
ncbi:urokinase plasminogen activator surface receptor-like [Polyodon spathula]|uniref:urokinase plasminogen activator surface receptor-like n=1 Tax=Polyodon spathula TaxID=7913 RepID=UPI001B7E2617|nr:urokinase plasminogen activator surface receptor-like [Polyodon spathula]